jgi:transglutaminase-like putative cysteine protease
MAGLAAVAATMVVYKVTVLGYSPAEVLPREQHRVTYAMRLDGRNGEVRVRTFLPVTDERQTIADERNDAPSFDLATELAGANRTAAWSAGKAGDDSAIRFTFTVMTSAVRYQLANDVEVPAVYPAAVAVHLRPEKDIQVDDPAVGAALARIGAGDGSALERLRRIYDFTAGLRPRAFKGTTDALTALRLGEASCNGKSRLFVALARAAGIPGRLVGGLILEEGSKRVSHQWVEAYVSGHWVPFCPTNHHFAELPARYLVLYRGDESLFRHTADINFDYRFEMTAELVPSPRAKASFRVINVWALFERLELPFGLLKTLLMLPFGALVVVLFRNVVGIPTFGTFLPALIAAAAAETGLWWGLVGLTLVVLAVGGVRALFAKLQLLHSPTLAVLLAAVVVVLLATTLVAERAGLGRLAHVTLFPIAVLAISAERFYLSLTEQGPRPAVEELLGTFVVIAACHVVMASLALQVLVIGFPEVLLVVVAANIYLGRWVGIRLSEYLRFRRILFTDGRRA